ncbi:GrpB family protein [Pseudalkalibacillus berkeleyi]|uniref:GrpB family protein n=1 Tax=Pseudalkalibacillus berkeleyi TaxID=1069813 RepID=A0ABS9GY73_9BACL|nr:GrpB family protein [Pseudalkalibacillus berkeleyi]MCF6137717.1 GrpB family protein [Pseudalkalibacillus berkeleyi]
MRRVEVCPYNEEWPKMFHQEMIKLQCIYGSQIVTIHHIGSTSIKGLNAKPIIDILSVVKDINEIDKFDDQMKANGYEPRGENGIPGRRYFQKGGNARTHHIHIYQQGDVGIERHIAFRDYLRSNNELKNKYGKLKEELSKQFPYDIASYIKGKEQMVSEIEKKALSWYRSNKQ